MTIRVSAAREVERLTADLRTGTPLQRDAAVARLRVIGTRAIPRLSELLASDAPPAARSAALKVLEGIDDPRTVSLALERLREPDAGVVTAAIGVLRTWIIREKGTRVLEALAGLALDVARDPAIRLAALDAVSDLPRHVVQPLLQQLPSALTPGDPQALTTGMEDPLSAREWLAAHGDVPLSDLHAFVRRSREREHDERPASEKLDWRVTRGAAHAALARRGSRVALYDLREAFDAAVGPLPLDFLTAVAALGDETCLEPLARSWAASPRERWWRERLREAATDILRRQGFTGRNAVVRRIRARWPGFL